MRWFRSHRTFSKVMIVLTILFVGFLCIPVPYFDDPYSTVLTASDGSLLGARIADDGQWRFPATDSYTPKYVACLLEFEDHYFFLHGGFNPVSFVKAFIDNVRKGDVVRGGSTLSMQVVRMARKNKPRTYFEKFIEVVLAVRLESRYSKHTILNLYAANAPYGGNVVGIDAAAWRYFQTSPDRLTWGEAATLAVLPNSPSLIHPGRSRDRLQVKRDELLRRLMQTKVFIPKRFHVSKLSPDDYELALTEDLPSKPYDMPIKAYHYLAEAK